MRAHIHPFDSANLVKKEDKGSNSIFNQMSIIGLVENEEAQLEVELYLENHQFPKKVLVQAASKIKVA